MGGLPTDRTVYAIHSHPQVPQRLLAALQEGVYRSEDAGRSWRKAEMPVASPVVAFAHHPEDPTRLFAATEEGEIVKSTDGGAHWVQPK